jgi:hypothetical protein
MSESPIPPTEWRGDPCFQDNVGRIRLRPSRRAGRREKDNSRRTGRTKNWAVRSDFLVTFRHTNRTLREPPPNSFRPRRVGNRLKKIWVVLLTRPPAPLLAMAGNAIRGMRTPFRLVFLVAASCSGISQASSDVPRRSETRPHWHNGRLSIRWRVGSKSSLSILPGI